MAISKVYSDRIIGVGALCAVDASQISIVIDIGGLVILFAVAASGWPFDPFGRRIMVLSGAVVLLVAAFPTYLLIEAALFPYIILGEITAYTSQVLIYSPLATLFCESLSRNVRYTAALIAYRGGAMIGGLSPVVATLARLFARRVVVLSLYLAACACTSTAALLALKDRSGVDLPI